MSRKKLSKEEHNYIQHDFKATSEVFNYLKGNVFTTLPDKESLFQKFINHVKKRRHVFKK